MFHIAFKFNGHYGERVVDPQPMGNSSYLIDKFSFQSRPLSIKLWKVTDLPNQVYFPKSAKASN